MYSFLLMDEVVIPPERRRFCQVNGEPERVCRASSKIEVGHFGLVYFSFVNMLFLAYRLLLTRR